MAAIATAPAPPTAPAGRVDVHVPRLRDKLGGGLIGTVGSLEHVVDV